MCNRFLSFSFDLVLEDKYLDIFRRECSENFKNSVEQMATDVKVSETIKLQQIQTICVEAKTWPI